MTGGPAEPGVGALSAGWAAALRPVAGKLAAMTEFLDAETAAGRPFLPAAGDVLRAFRQPFDAVRVLVLGQDPYPRPGHAVGLSFSVSATVTDLPGSLRNIFLEYSSDLDLPAPSSGDLSPWIGQGVLLLNTVLTVGAHQPASHRGRGWEAITEQAIRALAARPQPLVAILWGRDARDLGPLLPGVPQIRSAHPSAMSAHSGFFGSRPFTRTNRLLHSAGAAPVDWRLP